jgi:hypothetical protein
LLFQIFKCNLCRRYAEAKLKAAVLMGGFKGEGGGGVGLYKLNQVDP